MGSVLMPAEVYTCIICDPFHKLIDTSRTHKGEKEQELTSTVCPLH
ncbi:hypothetical protein T03_1297 [Trichinella britovi]|uniref:Uncharacterized protein n=1 Tax=Trichinella britovi TaxID=45882 RepID=A0A0V1AHX8_TRIBR|nr:hypothetical protein T03_1297 [Trichinella britovi]